MGLELAAAAVLLVGLIAYVIFGGADFGGGVWTALATGPRAAQQREAIFRAMGPVWETNHVWLILIIVTLFTVFPPAFADLFTSLFLPLTIALLGIVFRGAAFAFRHFGHDGTGGLPATGTVFSIASVIAPLSLGVGAGALAGGHMSAGGGAAAPGLFEPWLRPFPIVSGLIVLALCGFITAHYLLPRTAGRLQEDFRKRAAVAGLVLGALVVIAAPVAYWDANLFWQRVIEPVPLVLLGAAAVAWLSSLGVLWRRTYALAPPVAAGLSAMLIAGWAAAQYPYLILPDLRIADAAAESTTIAFFLAGLGAGAAVLIPSLVLLYRVFGEKLEGSSA